MVLLLQPASFGRIDVTNLSATSVDLTNCRPVGLVSSSAQLASQISGAFDSGFEFTGTIQPSLGAWSAGGALNTGRSQDGGVGTKDAFIATDGSGKTEIYNGSSWSEVNDMISGYTQQEAAGFIYIRISLWWMGLRRSTCSTGRF